MSVGVCLRARTFRQTARFIEISIEAGILLSGNGEHARSTVVGVTPRPRAGERGGLRLGGFKFSIQLGSPTDVFNQPAVCNLKLQVASELEAFKFNRRKFRVKFTATVTVTGSPSRGPIYVLRVGHNSSQTEESWAGRARVTVGSGLQPNWSIFGNGQNGCSETVEMSRFLILTVICYFSCTYEQSLSENAESGSLQKPPADYFREGMLLFDQGHFNRSSDFFGAAAALFENGLCMHVMHCFMKWLVVGTHQLSQPKGRPRRSLCHDVKSICPQSRHRGRRAEPWRHVFILTSVR